MSQHIEMHCVAIAPFVFVFYRWCLTTSAFQLLCSPMRCCQLSYFIARSGHFKNSLARKIWASY